MNATFRSGFDSTPTDQGPRANGHGWALEGARVLDPTRAVPLLAAAALAFAASVVPAAEPVSFGAADPVYFPAISLGKVSESFIDSVSGLVAGRTNPDLLWVVSGPDLHALARDGEARAAFSLPIAGLVVTDLAIGPGPEVGTPFLYVGDLGAGPSGRSEVRVLRIAEPALPGAIGLVVDATLTLRYPDAPRSAESLMLDPVTGDLVVGTSEPDRVRLYRAPGAALREGDATIDLQFVGESTTLVGATGGAISSDGGLLVLRSEERARLWTRVPGDSLADALARSGFEAPVAGTAFEERGTAIAFEHESAVYLTTSEGKKEHVLRFRPNPSGFDSGTAVGAVADESLKEISGCAVSRLNPGVLWVHNDGAVDRLHAIAFDGRVLAVLLLGRTLDDCEDLVAGFSGSSARPTLFIGDIGDNDADRSGIGILSVPEPKIDPEWTGAPPIIAAESAEWLALRYPGGAADAEALLHDPVEDELYVVTKSDANAGVFRVPASASPGGPVAVLEPVATLDFPVVSGGDISPDGTELILRREEFARMWTRPEGASWAEVLADPEAAREVPVMTPPMEGNGEAIAFTMDGSGYLTVGEKKNAPIYRYFRVPLERLVRIGDAPAPVVDGSRLQILGFPGITALIERSTDLADWQLEATVVVPPAGVATVDVPGSGRSMFFRMRR